MAIRCAVTTAARTARVAAPARSSRAARALGTRSAATRTFATDSTTSSAASYELIKKDFRRWLVKEAQVLSALLVVGATGVYFYKNRESAPSNKVLQLLGRAEESAKRGDREEALKLCLQAHAITKATNSRDRHLFELAFAIAAQYETLGKTNQALQYYQEALGNLSYVPDLSTRVMSRVVTLDRIAQSYQDKGEQVQAERYFREAIDAFDKDRATATSAGDKAEAAGVAPVNREIPAVLYNYGQQLLHLQRYDDAHAQLSRALALATDSSLPADRIAKIELMLSDIAMVRDLAAQASASDATDDGQA